MAWDYGTITDANPADALMDKIEGCMTDAAWTFEEELTPGEMGTTGLGRIWGNSNGFHVAIEVYELGAYVYLRLAEGYNAATNKCIAPARNTSAPVGADYSYGNSAEYTWANAALIPLGTLVTTGFTYAVSATATYLFVATLVGTAPTAAQVGKFDTLMVSDPGPYCGCSFLGGALASTTVYHTRVPNTTGTQDFGGSLVAHTDTHGTPATYDVTHNALVLSRQRITNRGPGSPDTHRGLLKGTVTMTASATYAFGDELDVDATPKYKVIVANTGAYVSYQAVEMV
jgi:hypothetical protein